MQVSIFDLFKVGIGPSSSHTMGPMIAAKRFVDALSDCGSLADVAEVRCNLYGSLALTGIGHGTDRAIMLGLAGHEPHLIDPGEIEAILTDIQTSGEIALNQLTNIAFVSETHLVFHPETCLPGHPNGLSFEALGKEGASLLEGTYYSIGGGFVVSEAELGLKDPQGQEIPLPHSFGSAAELLREGKRSSLSIWEMVAANERAMAPSIDLEEKILTLWRVMQECVDRGCQQDGILPGGLSVKRRAPALWCRLSDANHQLNQNPAFVLDWINLWAIAVNEENAAGGRVVTAPTNGAAGIIPAVLKYYETFCGGAPEGIQRFFLTAAAIGALFKQNASISGAEVGCQGEVGVACSMAAAGLTAALGGSNEQIENAAEIGMEHNLGLTCDPIGGLVQIPCIERNAMAAVKAVDASRLAMMGEGDHFVSLDTVIETMRRTGLDMSAKYKETSQGGLAVNLVEC